VLAINLQIRRDQRTVTPCSEDIAANVRRVLEVPDANLDFARAKIAFDALIDPQIDQAAILRELDDLTRTAHEIARSDPHPNVRLRAVRTLLHESGPWNDHRPFSYDQSDPTGSLLHNKLLHNYLGSRRGQCVSMPVLFLILGCRLGLDVALASAPEHVFVRYTDEHGRTHNLETTSGAYPARDEWYRQNFPITDRAVESGIYLRTLSAREAVAISGLSGVAAGGPWLGYPRMGFGGGGRGTSLISSASRSLGSSPLGGGLLGSGNLGSVAGRSLSRVSAGGGAALAGYSVGTTLGAVQVCQ